MPGSQACNACHVEKSLDSSNFYRARDTRSGFRGECIDCSKLQRRKWYEANREYVIERTKRWQRENSERHLDNQRERRQRPEVKLKDRAGHLMRKYGITLERYEEMFERQAGRCAICRRPPTEGISLHVDHDHLSGRVRGILCFRCNQAIGAFSDEPAVLRAAAGYLAAAS